MSHLTITPDHICEFCFDMILSYGQVIDTDAAR